MIRSMTGFGRGEVKTDSKQCIVEIKTVNHRYSDFIIKMPRELLPLEDRVRTELQDVYKRQVYAAVGICGSVTERFSLEGVKAVSYTHLDVYKRQVLRSEKS